MKTPAMLAVCAAAVAAGATANGEELFGFESRSEPIEWIIEFRGHPIMIYDFAPGKFKPYVKALYTSRGENVLRDSPFDHLHHHGLMYAVKVNGINFWEETAGCGVQKAVQTAPPVMERTADGLAQATLSQVLHWLTPEDAFLPDTNAPPLLVENRTLRLQLDEATGEVALSWKSQFRVGSKTNVIVLTGANYHGLGLRFASELDAAASHRTPEGMPDLAGTKQDVSIHNWEAVQFELDGRPATLALFGHPGNARGDAHYFAMHRPFAYLSATQGLDQEPLVYRAGQSFELSYLVTLDSEIKSTEALAARARQWRASQP